MVLLCCALPQPAAQPAQLLARIRQRMTDNLAHLPDYTCRLTIERSSRPAAVKAFSFVDRLRFEISYVGGKELFAWPGAEKFEEKGVFDLVPGGTAASGSFALHARAIFTTDAPTFEYRGEDAENGRKLLRWDFRVARDKSKYVVSTGPKASAVVAYHGSFWADAGTLDLARLEVETDEVPRNIDIARGNEKVVYARTRIGPSEFLLPRGTDLFTVDRQGLEKHNHTDYEACRQYTGESVVRFMGDDGQPPAATPKALKPLPPLPAGLDVEVILGGRVNVLKSAIGDQVSARLVRAVRQGNRVVVPKDAVLTGRICLMEQRESRPSKVYVIGVQFDRIEYAGGRGPFRGVLDSVGSTENRRYVAVPTGKDDLPGEGIFAVHGGQTTEVTNLRMVWRTAAVK